VQNVKITTTVRVTTVDLHEIGGERGGDPSLHKFGTGMPVPFQGAPQFTMFQAQVEGGRELEEAGSVGFREVV
jgi:hypothetical protein